MLLEERLLALPFTPGVYMFKDARGEVLYVGKAASLRSRVRAYFAPPEGLPPKTQRMVSRAADLDFVLTSSEQEALILENHLIKRHRPRYNVRLKDDKTYPYLKIDFKERFPRIYFTRRWEEDGARYFGPFASARSVRSTLEVLRRLFPFRTCTRKLERVDPRACLEYDINRCAGPCIGAVTEEEYKKVIRQVVLFLEGRDQSIRQQLREQMEQAAQRLEFERAAVLRDRLQAVERVTERQKLSVDIGGDLDVVAFARTRDLAYFQIFLVRAGKAMGKEYFLVEGAQDEGDSQVMTSFVHQFYGGASPNIPPRLLLQHPVEDPRLVEAWLKGRRGKPVRLAVPKRGVRRELVEMVAENARQGLEHYRITQLGAPDAVRDALSALKQELRLPRYPERIEGYDISNIQGEWAVGSMVVFEGGKPHPAHYRRFRVRTVEHPDDYAMLREVLRRRFARAEASPDTPWARLPDLLLVDGGKGQLSSALEVMGELSLEVPVASLAKEEEQVFVPGSPAPLPLAQSSPALLMLERVRDEAHRFAISYHLKVRRKAATVSALDTVPGIGPRRKRELLKKFGSLRGIREASLEELASVPGMTRKAAEKVKEFL